MLVVKIMKTSTRTFSGGMAYTGLFFVMGRGMEPWTLHHGKVKFFLLLLIRLFHIFSRPIGTKLSIKASIRQLNIQSPTINSHSIFSAQSRSPALIMKKISRRT